MKLKNILAAACAVALAGSSSAFAAKTLLKDNALASYYGAQYHGRPTTSGEIFDMYGMTAAHRTLPYGTMLEISNLENGNSVVVRVNDRGPFVEGREIDVSLGAAEKLGMITSGVARVSISILDDTEATARGAREEALSPVASESSAPQEGRPSLSLLPSALLPQPAQSVVPEAASAVSESNPAPASNPAPVAYAPASNAAPAAAYVPAGEGSLWRIQLGAFEREENAIRLVRQARAAGLEPAYERSEGTIRVVLAGVQESDLESVKSQLKEAGIYDYILRRER